MNNAEDVVPPTCCAGVFSRPNAEDYLMGLFLCWFRVANPRPCQAICCAYHPARRNAFTSTLQTYAKANAQTIQNHRNQPEGPGSDKQVNNSCSSNKRESRVESKVVRA